MPLKPYQRGSVWWAKGKVEYNGRPITDYVRESTGSSTEQGARDWIKQREESEIRRYLIGDEEGELTFMDAITLYDAKPSEAKFLLKVLDHIAEMPVSQITGAFMKPLGLKIYPNASTDTIRRQVLTPVSAVINNAHHLGKCSIVRFKGYSEQERIIQDKKRGKKSRIERKPATREWVENFCTHADPHNSALMWFLFETAARIDQAVSLEPEDMDLPNRKVTLKPQKGYEERTVTISEGLFEILANLEPKLVTSQGEKVVRVFGYGTRTGYRKAWKNICDKAGIPYISAHPAGRHGFYTYATEVLGVSSADAAKAGGWKSTRVPEAHYRHAQGNEQEIRDAFRTNRVQEKHTNQRKVLNMKEK